MPSTKANTLTGNTYIYSKNKNYKFLDSEIERSLDRNNIEVKPFKIRIGNDSLRNSPVR